jgi:hypothetical protein
VLLADHSLTKRVTATSDDNEAGLNFARECRHLWSNPSVTKRDGEASPEDAFALSLDASEARVRGNLDEFAGPQQRHGPGSNSGKYGVVDDRHGLKRNSRACSECRAKLQRGIGVLGAVGRDNHRMRRNSALGARRLHVFAFWT